MQVDKVQIYDMLVMVSLSCIYMKFDKGTLYNRLARNEQHM